MIKQFSLFTEHKKIFITVSVSLVFILLFIYAITIYQEVMGSKGEQFDDVIAYIEEMEPNADIIEVNRYHGDQLYYIIEAIKSEESYYYIVAPDDDNWEMYTFHTNELHSREEAMDEWKSRCNGCQYLHDEIGVDNGYIVLEVNYKNTEQQYVMEHILLEDLSHYKLTLKRSLEH
ncbi:uncharacterized protein YpmB [Gracilibacillus halotolerans]|uniref:Uncharacterized protein YpmB n=1 Tax=Gracilibacillus halotolerans TaxID=74386 RepID=A0A841RIZ0_9BACI|nr:hypothetical protein [Gracilibacillus halotolerans]MBB6511623.1 uncharacterized protein YpmB [Gracilibacillus halotolerans]